MKLIDKSALVAEIESKIKEWRLGSSSEAKFRIEVYKELSEWLDTLEVKEVDLDYIKDELDRVVKIYKPDGDFGWGTLYNVATHFFELGMSVSNKAQKGE